VVVANFCQPLNRKHTARGGRSVLDGIGLHRRLSTSEARCFCCLGSSLSGPGQHGLSRAPVGWQAGVAVAEALMVSGSACCPLV